MRHILLVVMIILALGVFAIAVAADTTHHKSGTDSAKEKHATVYMTKTQAKEIKDAAGKPVEVKLTDHQKEVLKESHNSPHVRKSPERSDCRHKGNCGYGDNCIGIYKGYTDVFGDDEFQPQE